MNIKLQKLITLFNERKTFFNNHPDTYRFMRDTLGRKMPEGTCIEISVKVPGEEKVSTEINIDKTDKKFVDSLSDILKE